MMLNHVDLCFLSHSAVIFGLWLWFLMIWEWFPMFCEVIRGRNMEEIESILGNRAERSSPEWVCIPKIASDFSGIQIHKGARDGFTICESWQYHVFFISRWHQLPWHQQAWHCPRPSFIIIQSLHVKYCHKVQGEWFEQWGYCKQTKVYHGSLELLWCTGLIPVFDRCYCAEQCPYNLWPLLLTWINFNPSMDK